MTGSTRLSEDVTIPGRFVGPPDSAHGGYACGVLAAALGDGPAEVTLRRPPPVDRPLQLVTEDGHVELRDGDLVVAEAVGADPVVDPPQVVSFVQAQQGAARFDLAHYVDSHPFPTCFACGPGRAPGDGLRLFPAEVGPRQIAWPWVPDASLAAADRLVDPVFLWAALDCPSGLAWRYDAPDAGPHVLGRLAAAVLRRPAPGEELVVSGWQDAVEGRKRQCGAVVWDAAGDVLAEARAVWIALNPSQLAQFGTA